MAERAGGSLILSESRFLRYFTFFLLYVGQGLPLGVAQVAFPAWLVMNGADDPAVAAAVGAAFFPWSIKFIPAALMDRYAYLPMGRRRLWLMCAQIMMVAGFAIAAVIAPGPEDLSIILYIILLIGLGSAIQDVAVDGMAVDILTDEEQGTASAWMFGGQTVGKAVSGALAGYTLQHYGSQTTFLLFLPIILAITLYVVAFRERPGEKRLPWSQGSVSAINLDRHVGAWWPILKTTIQSLIKPDSLKLLGAAACSRAGSGFFDAFWPIIGGVAFVGFTTAGYTQMTSTVDLIMAAASIFVGSMLTKFLGARVASVFVYLVFGALALFILYGQSVWVGTPALFVAMTCLWSTLSTLSSICTNPLRMQLSEPEVAATQFTIYNSLSNLPVMLGTMLFAALGGTKNMSLMLWTSASLMIVGALLYASMKVGSRHQAAELPEGEIN